MGTRHDCSADVAEFMFASRRKMSSLEATQVIMKRWPKASVEEIERARAIAIELLTADIAAESVIGRSAGPSPVKLSRPVATNQRAAHSKVDRVRILLRKLGFSKAG